MAQKSLIDLSKSVKINLAKVTKLKICAQVGATFDISGSAAGLYSSGVMQRLADRLFAVAFEFDDNGSLDAWAFHTRSYELESITEKLFGNYVNKYILQAQKENLWGGTRYSCAMEDIISHYYPAGQAITNVAHVAAAEVKQAATGLFGKVKSLFGGKAEAPAPAPVVAPRPAFTPKSAALKLPDPAYVLFVTDGDNESNDERTVMALLEEHKDKQIYWQFIGISPGRSPEFTFLKKLQNQFTNVGFYDAGNVDNVTDDALYGSLFTPKFVQWYEKAKAL